MDPHQAVRTLIDISARAVAQYKTCEEIEQHHPPLDEPLWKKVCYWACPQDEASVKNVASLAETRDHDRWEEIVAEYEVQNMVQVGFMVTADIVHHIVVNSPTDVSFTFEKQRITSASCKTCPNDVWCDHITVAAIHRLRNKESIPIHAPMTETFSTLTKCQLIKLIQYAIKDDPGGMVENVFKRVDELKDKDSIMSKTAGAADPTCGLGPGVKCTFDLSLDELYLHSKAFFSKFLKQYDRDSTLLSTYKGAVNDHCLSKVENLVHSGEIEAGGKVLSTLTIAVTNALSASTASCLIKPIENYCTLYILMFAGGARQELVQLCDRFVSSENEPLSVMIKRFEAIKVLQKQSSQRDRTLMTLGMLILKKLLQSTHQFSLLSESQNYRKAKDMLIDNVTLGTVKHKTDSTPTEDVNVFLPPKKRKLAVSDLQTDAPTKDVNACSTTTNSNCYAECVKTHISLADMEDTVKHYIPKTQVAQYSSSEFPNKESLSYCLLYVCSELCEIPNCLDFIYLQEQKQLLLAILRAFELAGWRIFGKNSFEISKMEHSKLQDLETKLYTVCRKSDQFRSIRAFNTVIQRIYKTMLMECHPDEASVCQKGMPLVLSSFLLDNTFTDKEDTEILGLCLYILRSYNRPYGAARKIDVGNNDTVVCQFEYWFSEVLDRFLEVTKEQFDESYWIRGLIDFYKDYQEINDGTALRCVWEKVAMYAKEAKDLNDAILLLLFNCIRHHNRGKICFGSLRSQMFQQLETICQDSDTRRTELVLQNWGELIVCFEVHQIDSLQLALQEEFALGQPMPPDLVKLFVNTLSTNYEHRLNSCKFLVFLKPEDENNTEAVRQILSNTDNFTTDALLFAAELVHDRNKHLESMFLKEPDADIFNNVVQDLLKAAFRKNNWYWRSEQDIEWIIKAFNDNNVNQIITTELFQDFLDMLQRQRFSNPKLILSLMSKIEAVENCDLGLGEKIIRMVNSSMFQHNYIDRASIREAVEYLKIIRSHLDKYSKEGLSFFRNLLNSIAQIHRRRKKLCSAIRDYFPEP